MHVMTNAELWKREVSLSLTALVLADVFPKWLRYWKSTEIHQLVISSFYKSISWLSKQTLTHWEYEALLYYYTENDEIKASSDKYFWACLCVPSRKQSNLSQKMKLQSYLMAFTSIYYVIWLKPKSLLTMILRDLSHVERAIV